MEGLNNLSDQTEKVLTAKIDKDIIDIIRKADKIYFAGVTMVSLQSWL